MKKFFVSIMALILGTTGYAVVDKTIETRVETLESQVSELQGKVDILESRPENSLVPQATKLKVGDTIKCFFEEYSTVEGIVTLKVPNPEKGNNEVFINNVTVTVVKIYNSDTYEHCIKPYRIRVDCDYKTIVTAPYDLDVDALKVVEGNCELFFELNGEKYATTLKSNYEGTASAEFDISYVEAIDFICGGFYSVAYL